MTLSQGQLVDRADKIFNVSSMCDYSSSNDSGRADHFRLAVRVVNCYIAGAADLGATGSCPPVAALDVLKVSDDAHVR